LGAEKKKGAETSSATDFSVGTIKNRQVVYPTWKKKGLHPVEGFDKKSQHEWQGKPEKFGMKHEHVYHGNKRHQKDNPVEGFRLLGGTCHDK